MRIGFFGGTFDPPHRGHLAVAVAAADAYSLQRVLLAPTGKQPLKPQGSSASFADRLAMVSLLCEADTRLEASALDAPRADGLPNFTVDTLTALREQLAAEDELFVILGADAFRDLSQWREPARLLALADWIVVSRPGVPPVFPREAQAARRDGRVHMLLDVDDPTSATDIRARLDYGLPCDGLIPAPILAYMAEHGLYRKQERDPKATRA